MPERGMKLWGVPRGANPTSLAKKVRQNVEMAAFRISKVPGFRSLPQVMGILGFRAWEILLRAPHPRRVYDARLGERFPDICRFIDGARSERGGKVYVHCGAGAADKKVLPC